MKKHSACKDCKDRYVGCHAKCEIYIAEKKEIKAEKEMIWKVKDAERVATGIDIKRIRKVKGEKV